MTSVRAAIGVLVVLTLTGCAGEQLSLGSSAPTPAPADASLAGRWILSAPNAPSCGLEFRGGPGARNGNVAPDGGCPGNFYTSRHWAMESGSLTITDSENELLAQFKLDGGRFEGQSASGTPVALSR
ncbi:MAG TPA: AprI/Inh family metalloprotease inhibitor [Pseudolabrys sp.]|nr:AprI/Inh family metalloprotease inhibitor [Pseudolabrys sp.]